jgi:hypothetical protein
MVRVGHQPCRTILHKIVSLTLTGVSASVRFCFAFLQGRSRTKWISVQNGLV